MCRDGRGYEGINWILLSCRIQKERIIKSGGRETKQEKKSVVYTFNEIVSFHTRSCVADHRKIQKETKFYRSVYMEMVNEGCSVLWTFTSSTSGVSERIG